MFLDFSAAHLTLSDSVFLSTNHLRVVPLLTTSGSQWFYWAAEVHDLAPDETGTIDLCWPPVFQASDLTTPSVEDLDRLTRHESFAVVLEDLVYAAERGEPWTRVPTKRIADNVVQIRLRGNGRPITVVTQIPYTPSDERELRREVAMRAPGTLETVGATGGGRDIAGLVLGASDDRSKPILHLQAGQHLTEFTGQWVLNHAVRELLNPGHPLLQRFEVHVISTVDVDGLSNGLCWHRSCQIQPGHLRAKNINRDWEDREYAETRAIRGWIETQIAQDRRYAALFDLHNGWENRRNPGACYTIFPHGRATEATRTAQCTVIDHLTDRTDHCPTGAFYWEHNAEGTFSETLSRVTSCPLSFTVEFSRFQEWSRETGITRPVTPGWAAHFAREWIDALTTLPTNP